MARIVQVGGGMCGLLNAVLLAKAGNDVTVLERDEMAPPDDPDEIWQSWERRGVNQFRMLHLLLPRFRALIEAHLPELVGALEKKGAQRYNALDDLPPGATGGMRDGDDRFTMLTGRRPIIEAAVGAVADATAGLTVRRGVGVEGLCTGAPVRPNRPHVTGVRLEGGEDLTADLVVDAMGRRSPLPRWLDAIGAPPVLEEEEDCGFLYFGRHFRSADGAMPPLRSGLLTAAGTISILTLPADNGTWGVGVITSSDDRELRAGLRDVERWHAVVRSIPAVAAWGDGEPLSDTVDVMARIPDRHRTFVVDGEPVATGVVAVADAWACTNPSVGRGITIGLLHALALRDTIESVGLDDPAKLALAFHDATMATTEPWYRATLAFDRNRLAEISALLEGREYESTDPSQPIVDALVAGCAQDPELLRGFLSIVGMLHTPETLFADTAFFEKVLGYAGQAAPPLDMPARGELVQLVS